MCLPVRRRNAQSPRNYLTPPPEVSGAPEQRQNTISQHESPILQPGRAKAVGWVWNIVKIIGTGFDVFTGMLIARCIGVFIAPLGAVLGYL